mmetsp:Transcript_124326/g.242277  ORF Transcript_124326/g.242277 Transcript_124326/m.242277 type:complete len:82 (+) Transcript_124326:109-354(+)
MASGASPEAIIAGDLINPEAATECCYDQCPVLRNRCRPDICIIMQKLQTALWEVINDDQSVCKTGDEVVRIGIAKTEKFDR